MNIEEADPLAALVAAGPWIRHVQLSDSNRLEPGAGHLDWTALLDAIWSIGYAGELAVRVPAVRPGGRGAAGVGAADAAGGVVVTPPASADRPATRDRRPAAGRGARADRQLARPLHRPVPRPLPAPVELGLGLHRPRPAALGPARAATELLSLFGAQWSDGRIPHIAFNPAVDPDAYFPGPTFWRSSDVVGHPPIDTSGIIQPPVHATAAVAVVDGLGEDGLAFARRVVPLPGRPARLPAPAAQRRPGRAGRGGAPVGDRDGQLARPGTPRCTRCRRTCRCSTPTPGATSSTPATGERPTDEDYARYIRLALAYRDHGYDDDWVRAESEFCVVDPTFNALWAWAEIALADLAGADRRATRPGTGPRRPGSPGPWSTSCGAPRRHLPGPRRPDRSAAGRAHGRPG